MGKEKPALPPRPILNSPTSRQTNENVSMLQHAWFAMKGQYPNRELLKNDNDLNEFSRFYNVLKTICRVPPQKRKQDVIQDILKESKIPTEAGQEIMRMLRSADVVDIDRYLLSNKPRLPTVLHCNYRISVLIATSEIRRSLTPMVQLSLRLSDGRMYDIEMNLEKFHLLRHSTATLLKKLQDR